MRRRDFITLIGGAAAAWPIAARGQAGEPARRGAPIGYLNTSSREALGRSYDGFALGMSNLGYVQGRDYTIEDRSADGDISRLPALAEDLVKMKPALILAGSTPATLAARQATGDIPIVGLLLTDPVGLGLIATKARPGANVTGILIRVQGMAGKQVEIATDLLPDLKKVGILVGLDNPSNVIQRDEAETAARKLDIKLVAADVRRADEISPAFQGFVREGVGVVLVSTYALFTTLRRQISAFALASRVPTIYSDREAVDYGGLISYGISRGQTYQRAAYYVNRILRGEKPADLPVEFPTKLELVINLATAKALGLSVPPTLLARADEVIE